MGDLSRGAKAGKSRTVEIDQAKGAGHGERDIGLARDQVRGKLGVTRLTQEGFRERALRPLGGVEDAIGPVGRVQPAILTSVEVDRRVGGRENRWMTRPVGTVVVIGVRSARSAGGRGVVTPLAHRSAWRLR
jgi:hypothetical protein